jgi:hypothetical protein
MTDLEKHRHLSQMERMCSAAAERWYEIDGHHRTVWCVGVYADEPIGRGKILAWKHVLFIMVDGYMPDSSGTGRRFSYFRSVYRTKDQRRHGNVSGA